MPALALHGIAIGQFGPVGFAVADVLIAIAVYFAARRLFHSCALLPLTAEVLAMLVACAVFGWTEHTPFLRQLPKHALWGYRFPRPFVTDLLLMLAAGSALRVFARGRNSTRDWLSLGLWFGLLLQSRFYTATTLGPGIGVGILSRSVLASRQLANTARRVGAFGFAAGLAMIPFLAQRLIEHPDVPVRFGRFPVDRADSLWAHGVGLDVASTSAVALLTALAIRVAAPRDATARLRSTAALAALCLLSVLALPVSILLLGYTIQPYHFLTEVVVFETLTLLVCAGQLIDAAARSLGRFAAGEARWLRPAAIGIASLVGIAASFHHHAVELSRRSHVRTDFRAYRTADYRASFEALTHHLASLASDSSRVVGTLDIQVHAW